jgi:transposase
MVRSRKIVARVTKMVVDGELSRREAAELLEGSVRTIHNYIKRYSQHGEAGLADHRGGRYHKLSPEKVRQIIQCKTRRPQRSARWIRDWLKLDVSVETVRLILIKYHSSGDQTMQSSIAQRPLNE